jgi:glycosyltransferase involved in cell wall biosynthesis
MKRGGWKCRPSIIKNCPICGKDKGLKFLIQHSNSGVESALFECRYCKVQFWEPFQGPGKEWYEKSNALARIDILKPTVKKSYHKEFLKRHKNFSKNEKIIDFGCGAGDLIGVLRKKGCNAWGVDVDEGAVKIAKKHFGANDLYGMSFEKFFAKNTKEKFDIITLFEVLEHLDNPLEVIYNLEKLLKPNGKIVLSTPSRNRILANLASWDFPPHHLSRWNKEAVSSLFNKVNLRVSYIKYLNEFNIILEAINEKIRTGLVNKISKNVAETPRNIFLIKIFYILARVKEYVFGVIPSALCFLWAKIKGFHGGTMYIELEKQAIKQQKIMFLIPTLATGGGERVVSQLSFGLDKAVEKIIVLFKKEISYPYCGRLVPLNIYFSGRSFSKIYNLALGFLKFRSLVKKEKPDYVISVGNSANIINILSGSRAIVRVDNFLSSDCRNNWEKIYKFLVKILFKRAYKIIAVSNGIASDLVENFNVPREKILVIYNPINLEEIKEFSAEPIEKEYEPVFKNQVVINIGRLSEQKGQWHLIKSFKLVKEKIKDAKLVILGEGKLEPNFKKLAEKMGLEKDVFFLGWKENPFKYLAKAKVFVLSSLWEGFGNVIVEAMACRLPVVSADCKSGPREIISPELDLKKEIKENYCGKFGVLTPAFNLDYKMAENDFSEEEKNLSKAIVKIISDKNLQEKIKNNSAQRAEEFDIKNIIKEWKFLDDAI